MEQGLVPSAKASLESTVDLMQKARACLVCHARQRRVPVTSMTSLRPAGRLLQHHPGAPPPPPPGAPDPSDPSPARACRRRTPRQVHEKQRGNPLLAHVRAVRWHYADIVPDYILGSGTAALFISLRFHLLRPECGPARRPLAGMDPSRGSGGWPLRLRPPQSAAPRPDTWGSASVSCSEPSASASCCATWTWRIPPSRCWRRALSRIFVRTRARRGDHGARAAPSRRERARRCAPVARSARRRR